jgi:hypothetical protein
MKPPGAILTKPSGGMWRANLILQKSREAMMAKKTSSLKDDGGESASSHIKPVSHSAVKEQFTTTGWQGTYAYSINCLNSAVHMCRNQLTCLSI